jgi:hypothetical protein
MPKLKDPKTKNMVSVVDKLCFQRKCYWPRPDPGVFTQGRGYSSRTGGNKGWLCGKREARGCPHVGACHATRDNGNTCNTAHLAGATKCTSCRSPLPPNPVDSADYH